MEGRGHGSGCSSSPTFEVTKTMSVGRRLTVVQWQLRSSRIELVFLSISRKGIDRLIWMLTVGYK